MGAVIQPLRAFRRSRISNLEFRTMDYGRQGLSANSLYAPNAQSSGNKSLEFLKFQEPDANSPYKSEILRRIFDFSKCVLSQVD